MVWRWLTAPAVSDGASAPCLVTQALATVAPEVQALTTALPPAVMRAVVTPLLERWAALCWDLPASAAHHHQRPFGLLQHSLEVAAYALTAFAQSSLWWQDVPDAAMRHRTQGRWQLGAALAGLLHDAGKIFDVTVTVPPASAAAAPAIWNPLHEPLLSFLQGQQHSATLPTPVLSWQPGRGMHHEAAGALAATLVLTRADLVVLTLPVARTLWSFLSGSPDPRNLWYQLIVQTPGRPGMPAADGQSVQHDLARTPLPPSALAARVVAMLAQCCQDGTVRVNQLPGQVFVQGDETLVVVPATLTVVRERLAAQGLATPEGVVLYNELASAGMLCGALGQNVAQAVFARPGKAPLTLAVLRVRTALLWGTAPPADYGGPVGVRLPDASSVDDRAVVPNTQGVAYDAPEL